MNWAEFAGKLPAITRPILYQHFRARPKIRTKPDQSPSPSPMSKPERALRRAILKRYPDHSMIGEEARPHDGTSPFTWVLDPIDGTRAFVSGNPLFGTLIAVLQDGVPKIGVIDLPFLQQCWQGQIGRPARTQTSTINTLAEARLATTSPQLLGARYSARFNQLAEACRLVNYGGDCANYAHLASGWCDLVLKPISMPMILWRWCSDSKRRGIISRWDGRAHYPRQF